jgi:hypothetical protein
MSKKIEYNYIKKEFEKESYILLSDGYKDNKQILKYVCPNGHTHGINWNNWRNGHRCVYCSGKDKLEIGFIKQKFEEKGYILLSSEYIYNKQKLEYICNNGHKHSISWNSFQKGGGCLYCSNQVKKDLKFIKHEFNKVGYIVLSDKYKNAFSDIHYICNAGHKNNTNWNSFQNGKRCPTCWGIRRFGSGNPSWKGGISCEPYCDIWLDKDFKESIKERDNYTCQNPNCWGTSKRLAVHHIDYDKKNCAPKNLITICTSCNARANGNRKEHEKYYKMFMSKRGLL